MRLDAMLGRTQGGNPAGDVIWCPPGKKHWHGTTATTAMSHVAIVEKLNGKAIDWMEKVSDEQYLA
jgi:quercetin dioxygenase-like cupin family protein